MKKIREINVVSPKYSSSESGKKFGSFQNFKKFTCLEMNLSGLHERGIPKTFIFLTFFKSTQKNIPSKQKCLSHDGIIFGSNWQILVPSKFITS
jgi:hypothetical protein